MKFGWKLSCADGLTLRLLQTVERISLAARCGDAIGGMRLSIHSISYSVHFQVDQKKHWKEILSKEARRHDSRERQNSHTNREFFNVKNCSIQLVMAREL